MKPENVHVKIMGRDYAFACAPDEKESLLKCVELVDGKMTLIRAQGKLTAADRIAVMAALTIASEYVASRLESSEVPAPVQPTHNVNTVTSVAVEGLEKLDLGTRMESTNTAIKQFLAKVKPQLGLAGEQLFS